jgi:beta-glucanase (GH16 family)
MKLVLAAVLMAALSAFAAPLLMIAPANGLAAVTASTDACGVQPLKPDGTPWRCTFDDEFAGSTLDRGKWVPQTVFTTGGTAAHACYVDSPSTINVSGGSLNLTVRKLSKSVACVVNGIRLTTPYVAGMVSTYHLNSWQYGRFEARIRSKATTAPGLHEAFWMWPDDQVASNTTWPESGEIDVSETYSVYPNLSIPFLHYSADSGGSQPGVNTAYDCAASRGVWNTYTLVWSPTRIEILVNGKSCLVNTSGDPAFLKPYIIALTAGLGSGKNSLTWRTPLPATMNIDYVRVWQ